MCDISRLVGPKYFGSGAKCGCKKWIPKKGFFYRLSARHWPALPETCGVSAPAPLDPCAAQYRSSDRFSTWAACHLRSDRYLRCRDPRSARNLRCLRSEELLDTCAVRPSLCAQPLHTQFILFASTKRWVSIPSTSVPEETWSLPSDLGDVISYNLIR